MDRPNEWNKFKGKGQRDQQMLQGVKTDSASKSEVKDALNQMMKKRKKTLNDLK